MSEQLILPVTKLTASGATIEIEQPDWWDAEMRRIFPEDEGGPPPHMTYIIDLKGQVSAWELNAPGRGWILFSSNGIENQLFWVEDDPAAFADVAGIRAAGLIGQA